MTQTRRFLLIIASLAALILLGLGLLYLARVARIQRLLTHPDLPPSQLEMLVYPNPGVTLRYQPEGQLCVSFALNGEAGTQTPVENMVIELDGRVIANDLALTTVVDTVPAYQSTCWTTPIPAGSHLAAVEIIAPASGETLRYEWAFVIEGPG